MAGIQTRLEAAGLIRSTDSHVSETRSEIYYNSISNSLIWQIGLLSESSRTFLLADVYEELFETSDLNKRPWRQSTVARGSNVSSRQIWSVTSLFPGFLVTSADDILDRKYNIYLFHLIFWLSANFSYPLLTEITGPKRMSMLFETIVQKTNNVAVGPLEYCGNGTVILTTHRKRM